MIARAGRQVASQVDIVIRLASCENLSRQEPRKLRYAYWNQRKGGASIPHASSGSSPFFRFMGNFAVPCACCSLAEHGTWQIGAIHGQTRCRLNYV